MVITVEIYKQIRRMRLDGMSQRQIAAVLHISRNTVKKYWDGNCVPWERKEYSREPVVLTKDVVAFVSQCVDEDRQCGSKKQHHTAKRIYDRLVAERGFTGGETTIRRLVKELREKHQEAFVPLIFPAGDAMQIDWGEATVYLNGVKTTVNLFCARMCYSGAPMVLAYRRQNEESFLDALVQVFQYFGGVPRRVIFDNGKVAVKDGFGAHARKQAGYAALAAHYGFEAVFCNPASGNEKGLVEGLVGYIRRNVCVPVPKVKSLEELNRMLQEKCLSYLSHQLRGKEATVGEMLTREREKLYPLPGYPFDACKRVTGRVDRFCTVRFDANNYSVPAAYCGREVAVKAGPETVSIYFEGQCMRFWGLPYLNTPGRQGTGREMGISPLLPQTIYSACCRKRPFWGRLLPLSQTAVPRQIQPAHWRASVAAGSCRQSMNIQIGAPGLQTFRARYSHSAAQRVQLR